MYCRYRRSLVSVAHRSLANAEKSAILRSASDAGMCPKSLKLNAIDSVYVVGISCVSASVCDNTFLKMLPSVDEQNCSCWKTDQERAPVRTRYEEISFSGRCPKYFVGAGCVNSTCHRRRACMLVSDGTWNSRSLLQRNTW